MGDIIEVFLGVVVLTILAMVAVAVISAVFADDGALGFGAISGEGEQIGYISEVTNTGFVWKPTEVRLINSEPTYSDEDTSYYYAVASKDIETKAKTAMKSHEKVVVKYVIQNVEPWAYSHRVVIVDIREEE